MVMGKNYIKVIFREIKNSFGRFLAITAIVALGVGFLVGILSTTPDMRASVDKNYNEKNMMDIFIKSTMGLTDKDINSLKENIEDIDKIMPAYVTDIILDTSSKETLVTRIYGLELEDMNKEEFINKLTLIEGEMPKSNNEVLIQKPIGDMSTIEIGSTLKISEENTNYEDEIKNYNINEYKVVGIVESPVYFSVDKEPSQVGAGKVSAIIYGQEEIFNLDVYTDIFITLDESKNLEAFSLEYKEYVESIVKKIEDLSLDRIKYRDIEVKEDGYEKIEEGKLKLSNEKDKINLELKDVKAEIDSGYLEVSNGQKEIKEGRNQIKLAEEKINIAQIEIEKNEDKLDLGYKEYLSGKEELDNAKEELDNGKNELDLGRSELINGENSYNSLVYNLTSQIKQRDYLNENLKEANSRLTEVKNNYDILLSLGNLDKAKELLVNIEALEGNIKTIEDNLINLTGGIDYLEGVILSTRESLDSGWRTYNESLKEYEDGLNIYNENLDLLNTSKQEIDNGYEEIKNAKLELDKGRKEISENKEKLNKAESEIGEALEKLKNGELEYNDGLKKANEEFLNAEKELKKAKDEVESLEKTKWYVLDRNSNVSYVTYNLNTQKVADIARVFPIFFFLVAGLVTLTTMTRMIEEERLQIGTLKALGFSKGKILVKYIAYCGIATFIGCVIGLIGGFTILPIVIYSTYKFTYTLPELVLKMSFKYASIACGLEIICTMFVTIYAAMQSMKEKPSSLMIAKAPKEGQRIWLEKIGFIWRRLSFSYKATARNIFRNKKNLLMTMTGIAGCTGLMLTAFGIKDSIGIIAGKQFEEIQIYDMKIECIDNEGEEDILEDFLNNKEFIEIHSETSTAIKSKERVNLTTYVSEDEKIEGFINFRERKTGEVIEFDEKSVIITEKVAQFLNVSVGDVIEIENSTKDKSEFKITGVTENYIGSYVYINSKIYEESFKIKYNNLILVKSNIQGVELQEETTRNLLVSDEVSSVEFTEATKDTYDKLVSSLNIVVVLLIFVSGALAVIVLYNIINVNINERIKELATLRVLGFHHEEVDRYIFREIRIMVSVGIGLGFILGVMLHRYVIVVIDTSELMVGRDIFLLSYVYAAIATLIFSELVRFIMIKKIKAIKMAESMKSVD